MAKRSPYVRALYATRKNNLRALVGEDSRFQSQQDLAAALGKSPAYLSQMIGKSPVRYVTEESAREFEQKLGLRPNTLDVADSVK